jgi:ribonuclease HI
MKTKIKIYTDGACSGNPGPGGWGALLIHDAKQKQIYGSQKHTTNNQMELMAAIEALACLKKPCTIELYTDSIYLKDGMTKWLPNWLKNNWQKRDNSVIKNLDLWQKLSDFTSMHDITWHWVKAHNGDEGNEIADSLAVKGRDEAKKML